MSKATLNTDTVHRVGFLDKASLHIPILRILQADGTTYETAVLPVIDEALATKIYDTCVFTRVLMNVCLAHSVRDGSASI